MIQLKEVAARAGVSISTVSRALNGTASQNRISAACQARIRKACDDLGYRPNFLGRALRSGQSHTIAGALFLEAEVGWSSLFWSQALTGMATAAFRSGRHLTMVGMLSGETLVEGALSCLQERRADGLAVGAFLISREDLRKLEKSHYPVVLMGPDHTSSLPQVRIDEGQGVELALEHLWKLGHRRVLWINHGTVDSPSARTRLRALRKRCSRGYMQGRVLTLSASDRSNKIDEDLLAGEVIGRKPCTAILCYRESLAIAVLAMLKRLGRRVPEDISLVGFDNIHSVATDPPLTSVDLNLHELGARAVELLVRMIEEPNARRSMKGLQIKVPCTLVPRTSSSIARAV